jgi:CubicO group peptidase (beta-lactamase class C family)
MEKRSHTQLRKKLDRIIEGSLKNHSFSGCALGFFMTRNQQVVGETYNYGRTGLEAQSAFIDDKTAFDLASLTKPLVTTMATLSLLDKGKIDLEDCLSVYFKDIGPAYKDIKVVHLLNHSSGLPAHKPYFNELLQIPEERRMDHLITLILSETLSGQPGNHSIYSDLGFILLGWIIEKISGERLDIYWEKNILRPMHLEGQLFFNSEGSTSRQFAMTGTCPWSKKNLRGKVHDDNCRVLGGVAGHAGLFGTIVGVLSFVEKLFLQYKGIQQHPAYDQKILKKVFAKPHETSSWALGFDTPSAEFSSSGKYFSDKTVGHLGFTGTSFWLDLKNGCAVVLLTNRVLYSPDMVAIRKLRPLVHNTIMEYILNKRPA